MMADLEEALKHLAFDVHHFRSYACLYREGALASCSPLIAQGVRYSLLLHFRVLLNFFNAPPRRDDNRWVGNFRQFSRIEELFKSGVLTPNPKLKEVAVHLNKRLAHFTATRWKEKAPDMAFYAKHFHEIEQRITAFQTGLPAEMRQFFSDALNDWERKHPAVLHCSRERGRMLSK
jgi:hypothetical protein